jgi:hypothetical protein
VVTASTPSAGGLERVSATTFEAPEMCRNVAANSAINDSWRHWRADQGSDTLLRLPNSGRWSVNTVKLRPSSINLK